MNISDINSIISEAIQDSVKKAVKEAPFDRTYIGVITAIENANTFQVTYDGKEKTIKTKHSPVLKTGDTVHVIIPRNNMKNIYLQEDIAFISGSNTI